MHIALLTSFFPPDAISGIGRYIEDLASALTENGHDVVVISLSSDKRRQNDVIEDRNGYRIHWIFSNIPRAFTLIPSIYIFWLSLKIRNLLAHLHENKPFDIVEYPNTEYPALASLLIKLKKPRPSFVLRLSSPRFLFKKTYKMIRISEFFEKYQAHLSDGIIGNTKVNFDLCQNIYGFPDKLPACTILHGLPYGKKPFQATPASNIDNTLRILFLGRMEYRKGFDILAKAWPIILSETSNIKLIIGGEDQPFQGEPSFFLWAIKDMPEAARSKIEYLGIITEEKKESLYQRCDVCVVPSRYESFGLTSLEAMRYGKPVVSCNVGGIPEVIQHGITGLLVPVDEHRVLAEALVKILKDSDFRQQLGKNALLDVSRRFNIDRVVIETVNFYTSLPK